jgi:hypothetical protein
MVQGMDVSNCALQLKRTAHSSKRAGSGWLFLPEKYFCLKAGGAA